MTSDCVHVWEEFVVEVGPASAETWGPTIAAHLDDPKWGAILRESVEAGALMLSDAEAGEHVEMIGGYRVCGLCGAHELLDDDGSWCAVKVS